MFLGTGTLSDILLNYYDGLWSIFLVMAFGLHPCTCSRCCATGIKIWLLVLAQGLVLVVTHSGLPGHWDSVCWTPVLLWRWRQASAGWMAGDGPGRSSSDFSLSPWSPLWVCRWAFTHNLKIFLNGRELLLCKLFWRQICRQHKKGWRDTQINMIFWIWYMTK